jgi:signal peptidase I
MSVAGSNSSVPDPVPLWKRLTIGADPRRTLRRVAIMGVAGGLVFLLFTFVLEPVRISGISMAPTYHDRSLNLINRLAYHWRSPRRGEVVCVMMSGKHAMLLKRIIGLPGETVAIERGIVLINGQPLDEPYVRHRAAWEVSPHQLGPDDYLVIGDNRGMDQRAHEFGVAKAKKIAGPLLW